MNRRLAVTVGGTLACALGIGFVMQHTGATPQLGDPMPQQAVAQTGAVLDSDAPLEIDNITLTSARPPQEEVSQRHDPQTLPQPPKDPQTPRFGCHSDPTATATTVDGAQVRIDISAPCLPNERLTLHHSGLMFSAATDRDGAYSITVPAFAEHAVFIIDFKGGTDLVATAMAPEVKDYDRFAIQWSGQAGFEIHALEFGAGYGDQGHVWSGAEAEAIGQVVRLGEAAVLNPLMAEIYSFPRTNAPQSGDVALSIETEVTAENCGRDVSAQALELRDGASLRTRDMVLSMPNCGAMGDFLVLNNLVEDLKIAAK